MRCLALLSLLFLTACIPQPKMRTPPTADAIAVTTRAVPLNPQDPAQAEIGRLRYMGGVQIDARDPRFGGLSGLRFYDGTFYAVSDEGDFVRFQAIEQGDRLTGIENVRIRRLNDLDGRPIAGKPMGDAEALELLGDAGCAAARGCAPVKIAIAFEGRNQLLVYPLTDGMPIGAPVDRDIARAWRQALPHNGGMEAIAATADVWVLLSEERRNAKGEADGRLHMGEDGDQSLGIPVTDGFGPTDAAIVEGGDGVGMIVLQRRFSPVSGVAARLAAFSIVAGDDGEAVIGDVQTLATLRPPLNIDNMEGLAVRQQGKRTFLYIVSDDNFSPAQRTLLLKFEVTR